MNDNLEHAHQESLFHAKYPEIPRNLITLNHHCLMQTKSGVRYNDNVG